MNLVKNQAKRKAKMRPMAHKTSEVRHHMTSPEHANGYLGFIKVSEEYWFKKELKEFYKRYQRDSCYIR